MGIVKETDTDLRRDITEIIVGIAGDIKMATKNNKEFEKEFCGKFNHFNDLYLGHKRNENNPEAGKQICDEGCENVYDLEDVWSFIDHALAKQREEIKKEIEGFRTQGGRFYEARDILVFDTLLDELLSTLNKK